MEKGEWGDWGVEEEIDGWRVTGGGSRVTNNTQPATFWVSRKDAKARRDFRECEREGEGSLGD